jgi:hypothetical protein
MLEFSNVVHMIGKYPQLAKNKDFWVWTRKYPSRVWHESQNADTVTVIVQSLDGLHMFAIQLQRGKDPLKPEKLLKTADVDVLQTGITRDEALLAMHASKKGKPYQLHAVRPVVHLTDKGADLSWEIETINNTTKEVYRFTKTGGLELLTNTALQPIPPFAPPPEPIPPTSDSLADNELHHLTNLNADAVTAAGAASSTEGKARGIFNYVRNNYLYDGTIFGISNFTWADILTRDTNGRRGICDEWAVIQVSMLRSLGIPAVIKFLIWNQGSQPVGHACLEYLDGTLWFHMDALWNAFHNPGVYRVNGATSVTVMDADYPIDSRSTVPAWELPDPTGDLKLHPYYDFVITPSYPGNSRSGYSY